MPFVSVPYSGGGVSFNTTPIQDFSSLISSNAPSDSYTELRVGTITFVFFCVASIYLLMNTPLFFE